MAVGIQQYVIAVDKKTDQVAFTAAIFLLCLYISFVVVVTFFNMES